MSDVLALGTEAGQAHCSDPRVLPIVDAAFTRPGSLAGRVMRERVCPGCPLQTTCLDHAMVHGEWGVWAGTTPRTRTSLGGVRPVYRSAA